MIFWPFYECLLKDTSKSHYQLVFNLFNKISLTYITTNQLTTSKHHTRLSTWITKLIWTINTWKTKKLDSRTILLMLIIIHYCTHIEKGVKYCGKKHLLTRSVWKYDFQTSIHLELFQHSLVPRSSLKISRWNSVWKA